jgi:hypothetical protein
MMSPMDSFGDSHSAGRGPSHGRIMRARGYSANHLIVFSVFDLPWTLLKPKENLSGCYLAIFWPDWLCIRVHVLGLVHDPHHVLVIHSPLIYPLICHE